MKIFRNTYQYNIDKIGHINVPLCNTLFFDIETTGFSAAHSKVYLIGCLYYDSEENLFRTIQWFMDKDNEEDKLIAAFFDFSKDFTHIIHFNGDGFDIPYITSKCRYFKLFNGFSALKSIDIYRSALVMKNVFKLQNLKQKTIEDFLNLHREDKYSGRELIEVYESYLKNKDNESLALLVLHNLDDIKGLLNLLTIFNYAEIFNGSYNIQSISIEKNEAVIEARLFYTLPSRISASLNTFYMTAYGNTVKIKINIYTDELKFFYSNYKDYYFLPEEDCSIHKSVAFYVDKNFRTQAKAANCYSKKTGNFLPQYKDVISPYFKREYNDKITYFEVTEEFLKDASAIKAYSLHILNLLLKS